ncbi:MAG: septal ring lytic transglycosylase RlpA family protein [Cyclobacteriaceae bacterium]
MISAKRYFLFLVCPLLMSSCQVVKSIPSSRDTSGKNIEQGVASWYGPNFHGKQTANGEIYDMNALTAAHRTLPFNSVVKVVNLANGLSVEVRINDRGPYAKNRIIDLSKGAAEKIQMIQSGTTNVELILLKSEREISKELSTPHYCVQVGSFSDKTSALNQQKSVKGARIEPTYVNGLLVYRVYVGMYTDQRQAIALKEELGHTGVKGFVKQVEN